MDIMKKMKDIFKTNYPFVVSMATRLRDLDSFQHVNNAVYATYIENARSDMLSRWNLNSGKPIHGRLIFRRSN